MPLLPVLLLAVALAGCVEPETTRRTDAPDPPSTGSTSPAPLPPTAPPPSPASPTNPPATAPPASPPPPEPTPPPPPPPPPPQGNTSTCLVLTPEQMQPGTYTFCGGPPADGTFQVDQAYALLRVNATASGDIANLRVTLVDPPGTARELLVGNVRPGDPPLNGTLEVPSPTAGTWTVHFEGEGRGDIRLDIRAG